MTGNWLALFGSPSIPVLVNTRSYYMNFKAFFVKLAHALVAAAAAVVAATVPALGIPVAAKAAIGAALGYLVKPARPAP